MNPAQLKTQIKGALLGMPVLVKVMGIALAMTVFLGSVMSYQIHHAYLQLEEKELDEQASFVAKVLALGTVPLLANNQLADLQHLLDQMAEVRPATGTIIDRLQLLDGEGRVVVETLRPPMHVPTQSFASTEKITGGPPGSVLAVLGDGHIGWEIGWHTRRIITTTAVIALVGLGVGWWLMRIVVRPIGELVEVTRAVKAGDVEVRATVRMKDEVGELAGAFNDMMAALRQKDALNQRLMRRLLAADDEQRKHVSHDLREQSGQALAALVVGLSALESGADIRHLGEMRALASRTLGELHALSVILRPSALEDLGIVSALRDFCRAVSERFGVNIDCSAIGLDETRRVAGEIEVALFRIGQEAIDNAVRHGRPRSVDVLLHRKEASILAVVEDDGQGFDASDWRAQCLRENRLGLLGIEERATLLGGTLAVESRPGAGTSLFVEIPLRKEPDVENPCPDCR